MLALKDVSAISFREASGKSLGYAVHASQTKKALKRIGVSFSDDAKVVFHQMAAAGLEREEGKLNVLYTAWESELLPPQYIEGAKQADLIICVSDFVTNTFKRYLPKKPIVTVPLGVDINLFEYK